MNVFLFLSPALPARGVLALRFSSTKKLRSVFSFSTNGNFSHFSRRTLFLTACLGGLPLICYIRRTRKHVNWDRIVYSLVEQFVEGICRFVRLVIGRLNTDRKTDGGYRQRCTHSVFDSKGTVVASLLQGHSHTNS